MNDSPSVKVCDKLLLSLYSDICTKTRSFTESYYAPKIARYHNSEYPAMITIKLVDENVLCLLQYHLGWILLLPIRLFLTYSCYIDKEIYLRCIFYYFRIFSIILFYYPSFVWNYSGCEVVWPDSGELAITSEVDTVGTEGKFTGWLRYYV